MQRKRGRTPQRLRRAAVAVYITISVTVVIGMAALAVDISALIQEIAAIRHRQELYAAGNPEEYTEQLEAIFRALGGKRSVALIE